MSEGPETRISFEFIFLGAYILNSENNLSLPAPLPQPCPPLHLWLSDHNGTPILRHTKHVGSKGDFTGRRCTKDVSIP